MKNKFSNIFFSLPLLLFSVIPVFGAEIRWNNEAADTLNLNKLLKEATYLKFDNPGERVAFFGKKFIGYPYKAHTLEGEIELLTIHTEDFDCTTFVDVALALALASAVEDSNYQTFATILENMRYRDGECRDYASRLHYNTDWAAENIKRGKIIDVTPDLPGKEYLVRTLDFMTTNRSLYPALSDSDSYSKIKEVEKKYQNYKIPYIPVASLTNPKLIASLKEGDIICFATNRKDLDMAHLGILIFQNEKPYIMHASSSHGKIEISRLQLPEFVRNNKKWTGIRVLRLSSSALKDDKNYFTSQLPFCQLFLQMISEVEHYISALLP